MIELNQVVAAYERRVVLDIHHLEFPAGTISALTGANGSGKSTLLMILAGLIIPRQGTVLYQGKEITGLSVPDIGLVLQRPVLFAGTVQSNAEYGLKCHGVPKKERQKKLEHVLALTGLTQLANRKRRQLSGGEIQRVALARVLALEPKVLLLDEPFTHLDRDSAAILLTLIHQLKESFSTTIILASHDAEKGLSVADNIFTLDQGRLSESPILNVFKGVSVFCDGEWNLIMDQDKCQLTHTTPVQGHCAFQVDPAAVTIAKEPHISTARNQFSARISGLIQKNQSVVAYLEAGFRITVHITAKSCSELNLNIGDTVWVSFKASSMKLIQL